MTPRSSFDYDAFMRAYRAACAARGIDPERGASGYQVVHVITERKAKRQADRWWQRHERWLSCPPYRSDTEQEAIWNVFTQAYAITAARMADAICRRHRMAEHNLHG